MLQNEQQTANFKQEIAALKANIQKLQPEYDKKSKLFHSQKEVEGLYQNISDFASMNSLNIINLNKENPVPVSPGKKAKKVIEKLFLVLKKRKSRQFVLSYRNVNTMPSVRANSAEPI